MPVRIVWRSLSWMDGEAEPPGRDEEEEEEQ